MSQTHQTIVIHPNAFRLGC